MKDTFSHVCRRSAPGEAVHRMFSVLLGFALVCGTLPKVAEAATACDVRYPSDSTAAWNCRRIAAGETLESLFGARWKDVARFNRMDRRHAWPGARIRVPVDLSAIANFSPMPGRYADAESSARYILIDLREQFLGAYEYGRLVHSFPIASGRAGHDTPAGDFEVDAADARHASSKYTMEGTTIPYPMHWALRFHRSKSGVAFWIHGRDLPGVPASHGCVGLTDESMQHRYYGRPTAPEIEDARTLFEWAIGTAALPQSRAISPLPLRIVGSAPRPKTSSHLAGSGDGRPVPVCPAELSECRRNVPTSERTRRVPVGNQGPGERSIRHATCDPSRLNPEGEAASRFASRRSRSRTPACSADARRRGPS